MASPRTASMRAYWEERARLNAAFYVDTSLDYEAPDMERFLETGRVVVGLALDDAPVTPAATGLAVEIGCGLGRICLGLTERFDRVIGYDISSQMLEQAKAIVADRPVELRLTDGASLPGLEDQTADLVVTFTVFQHIPDVDVIRRYIREAGRALAPGGVFAFQWNNTPGSRRWRVRRTVMAGVQRLGRGDRYGRDQPEFLGSRVPLAVIDAALADAGLRRVGLRDPDQLFTWAWAVRS
ncbi:MAG: class SAM-dependent methyltransferase [Frankiales bacterium]|nr:class SAM-dependent methyltransferase [Frankiales bacterium]